MFKYTLKSQLYDQQQFLLNQKRVNSSQLIKNKYYTQVGQRLGQLVRRQFIIRQKVRNQNQIRSLQIVRKSMQLERPVRLPPKNFQIHDHDQYIMQKKQLLASFKYDLQRKRQRLALSREKQLQQKINIIKWRKKQNRQAFRIRSSFHQMNKQRDINLMKQIKNRSRQEKSRLSRQRILQKNIHIYEKKIRPKTMVQPHKKFKLLTNE